MFGFKNELKEASKERKYFKRWVEYAISGFVYCFILCYILSGFDLNTLQFGVSFAIFGVVFVGLMFFIRYIIDRIKSSNKKE